MITVFQMNSIDTSIFSHLERTILIQKNKSPILYQYESLSQLQFELRLRTNIVEAAHALLRSKAAFAAFKESRCNIHFWNRTEYGGFKIKEDTLPSTAIRDIFTNGSLYAFECSAAMVIVLYMAVLDSIGEHSFNRLFADLLLWDWNYDKDLRLITIDSNKESVPGDILYFKNPDVSPHTPEWRGENVVKLEEDLYYGHGIGIKYAEDIIAALNQRRKPGSTQSAYLLDQATYPDFKYLFQFRAGSNMDRYGTMQRYRNNFITSKIGSSTYIRV